MDTNNYQIGNIFQDNLSKSFLTVAGISEKKLIYSVIDRTKYPLPEGWQAEPVPISEEILVDICSFEKFISNQSYQLDTNLGFCFWGRPHTGIHIYADGQQIGEPMMFLHQIQNTYQALTHKKLPLKNLE